jgi:hypothetical protein
MCHVDVERLINKQIRGKAGRSMMAQKKLPKWSMNLRQQQCQQRPNNADDGKRTARVLVKTRPEEENPKYQPREVEMCRKA